MSQATPSRMIHRRALAALNAFMKMEAAGGIILVLATVVAMIVANSSISGEYLALLHAKFNIGFGDLSLSKTFSHWINDGLMVIFFLVVGLELKREIVEGQFADRANITLPVIGALGGMAVPMLIYAGVNWGDSPAMRGTATISVPIPKIMRGGLSHATGLAAHDSYPMGTPFHPPPPSGEGD